MEADTLGASMPSTATIEGFDILCFSTSPWEAPYGSRQELMSRLARTNRVLFVEYQAHWLHPFRYLHLRRGAGWIPGHIRRPAQSLWVYTPPFSVPGGLYGGWLNSWNQRQLLRSLRPILRRLGFHRPILWTYPPRSALLLGKLNERLRIYHCIEAFEEQKQHPSCRAWMVEYGRRLTTQCEIVMACSHRLCDQLHRWRQDVVFLPPGVDLAVFDPQRATEPPPELRELQRPLLGYIGSIDQRVDVELLEAVARACPKATLVLVGPIHHAIPVGGLRRLPNVRLIDPQPKEVVPRYIRQMDVCLIPYKVTPFTEVILPLKLFEYLAMGKSVVSTHLKELRPYASVIRLVDTPAQFIAAVQATLASGATQRSEEVDVRRQLASWDDRVAQVSELIRRHLPMETPAGASR